jgi:alginate O-acetyltransferase complex protein AlgI
MLFPTYGFFIFFCIVYAVHWGLLRTNRRRLAWLLLASSVFYAAWNPWLLSLIALSASVDYVVGRRLAVESAPRRRRLLFALSLTVNFGILAIFKYARFLLESASALLHVLGVNASVPAIDIPLPLGISFYTFETVSYVVDVYRGRYAPARSLLDYALFIMFFPHLLAGPIVRPGEFLPQLQRERRWNAPRLELGLRLFLWGLFKKIAIADSLALALGPVFEKPGSWGSGAAWLAVVGFAAQIYCDFSGYTDMAIGLAQAFGITLPRNFNRPYFAPNIAELWRRWHMTLSRWLRDYLYIPLGGSRGPGWETYRNLLVTMALAGLWHGAGWRFVIWGTYHGLLLSGHRALFGGRPEARGVARPFAILATFFSFCLGLAVFRAPSLSAGVALLRRLLVPTHGEALLPADSALVLLCGILFVFVEHAVSGWEGGLAFLRRVPAPVLGAALAALLFLGQVLMPETGRPFVYFQF